MVFFEIRLVFFGWVETWGRFYLRKGVFSGFFFVNCRMIYFLVLVVRCSVCLGRVCVGRAELIVFILVCFLSFLNFFYCKSKSRRFF